MPKWLSLILLVISWPTFAQKSDTRDTAYFESYSTKLTTRLYMSKKYTTLRFVDRKDDISLQYVPNTTLNLGIGATYGVATLNLAYGFGFLNPEDGKGETKYLDLQGHFYGATMILDFFGQFYEGFYLNDRSLRDADGNYYARPDLRVRQVGVVAQFVLNDKFSYRAAFLQNEWQKKSAGTFLVGWQLQYGSGAADSSIIPKPMRPVPSEPSEVDIDFIQTGPSGGYAYTWVIKKHFFLMGSASLSLALGYNRLKAQESDVTIFFLPNLGFKTAIGYNSKIIAVSFTFTNETITQLTQENRHLIQLNTGNFRLNFVRRFNISKKVREAASLIKDPRSD